MTQIEEIFYKPVNGFLPILMSLLQKKQLDQDKIAIIWMEDDWKLNKNNIPLQELLETYFGKMAYINLSYIRENYVPCFST